jgi:hypothetical protein
METSDIKKKRERRQTGTKEKENKRSKRREEKEGKKAMRVTKYIIANSVNDCIATER